MVKKQLLFDCQLHYQLELEFRIYNSLFQIAELMINKNCTIYGN